MGHGQTGEGHSQRLRDALPPLDEVRNDAPAGEAEERAPAPFGEPISQEPIERAILESMESGLVVVSSSNRVKYVKSCIFVN